MSVIIGKPGFIGFFDTDRKIVKPVLSGRALSIPYKESLSFRDKISSVFPYIGQSSWVPIRVLDRPNARIKEIFIERSQAANWVELNRSSQTFDLSDDEDVGDIGDIFIERIDEDSPCNDMFEEWDKKIRKLESGSFVESDGFIDDEIQRMRELITEIQDLIKVYGDPKIQPITSYKRKGLYERECHRIEHINEICRPKYDAMRELYWTIMKRRDIGNEPKRFV